MELRGVPNAQFPAQSGQCGVSELSTEMISNEQPVNCGRDASCLVADLLLTDFHFC